METIKSPVTLVMCKMIATSAVAEERLKDKAIDAAVADQMDQVQEAITRIKMIRRTRAQMIKDCVKQGVLPAGLPEAEMIERCRLAALEEHERWLRSRLAG